MNNDATVTLSLEDFDELRKNSKAYEALKIDLSSCMKINLIDYQKRIQHLNEEVKNMTDEEYDKALDNLLSFITIRINKPLLQRALLDNYKPKNVQEEIIIDGDLFEKDDLKIEYIEEKKNE